MYGIIKKIILIKKPIFYFITKIESKRGSNIFIYESIILFKDIVYYSFHPLELYRILNYKIIILLDKIEYNIKYKDLIIREGTTDMNVFENIFKEKSLDVDIYNPKIIIDCGAYTGYSTFFFSKKYKKSKVIALEPEKSNFDILKKNTKKLKNVFLLNKAIHHKKTRVKILNNNVEKWAFQVGEEEGGDIESVTVKDLMNEFNFNYIDILKIDIEGSEKELFDNSTDWINNVGCIIVELHDRFLEGCSDSFFKAIELGCFQITRKGAVVIAINKNERD